LKKFKLANEGENYQMLCKLCNETAETEHFPLGFFPQKQLEEIDFSDITFFYGGNGSGKTTLLNIIAESLNISRASEIDLTAGMSFSIPLCEYRLASPKIPEASKILTSDDIFCGILANRGNNMNIEQKKQQTEDNYWATRTIHSTSKKKFLRNRIGEKKRQYSNGESALMFFDDEIKQDALYLLDEPENSMSPAFQLEFRKLIADAARFFHCQFIIASHSPFLLSIPQAKIYNLDDCPVSTCKWWELENVRTYYDFFKENQQLFAF
jgi:predicted ATPase